jgi:hypothetical protein
MASLVSVGPQNTSDRMKLRARQGQFLARIALHGNVHTVLDQASRGPNFAQLSLHQVVSCANPQVRSLFSGWAADVTRGLALVRVLTSGATRASRLQRRTRCLVAIAVARAWVTHGGASGVSVLTRAASSTCTGSGSGTKVSQRTVGASGRTRSTVLARTTGRTDGCTGRGNVLSRLTIRANGQSGNIAVLASGTGGAGCSTRAPGLVRADRTVKALVAVVGPAPVLTRGASRETLVGVDGDNTGSPLRARISIARVVIVLTLWTNVGDFGAVAVVVGLDTSATIVTSPTNVALGIKLGNDQCEQHTEHGNAR